MTTDLALATASELTELYRAGTASPVEATEAALARIEAHDGALNAFRLVDPEGGAGKRAQVRGALACRRPPGPARRRPGDGQGSGADPRLVDPARLAPHRRGPALARRCAGGRPPARPRRRAPGQDDDARVRLEGRDRQPLDRHHAQPLEHRAHTRRLQWRGGGRCRHGHGGGACGHRRRRLDPHPVELHRHRRPQGQLSAGCRSGHMDPSAPSPISGRSPAASPTPP